MAKRKTVRLKDIAQRTGFTINTVSRALKNKDDISDATKKLINQTADEMGYIRDTLASSMRTGKTKTIAIILGDIANLCFSLWIKQIEHVAYQSRYSTIIFNTDENPEVEKRAIQTALSKKVDGILLCPTQESAANVLYLKQTGVPFVLIGRHFPQTPCSAVVYDDEKGGYLATAHLLQKGHRHILMLNGSPHTSSASERQAGYERALFEAGIPLQPELIRPIGMKAGDCAREFKRLIGDGLRFSAIFAYSDLIAFEAIYTLRELGISVPDQVGIVGFDNIQQYALFSIPLDTIATVDETVPKRATKMLIDKIQNREETDDQAVVLDVTLVQRGSAGNPACNPVCESTGV